MYNDDQMTPPEVLAEERRRAQQLTEELIRADIARSLPQGASGSLVTRNK